MLALYSLGTGSIKQSANQLYLYNTFKKNPVVTKVLYIEIYKRIKMD